MKRQTLKHIICLTVVAGWLCYGISAIGEQASLEALLDVGTTIETIEPSQENAAYALASISRDGLDAVAVFAQVEEKWALEAQSPWFSIENERTVSLLWVKQDAFTIGLCLPDDRSLQSYTFEKTDEGWQAVTFTSENLRWQQQEDKAGFRYYDDSISENSPVRWHVMLSDIIFSKMPQTMDEMRAILWTDDMARITLAEYATVPLREAPTEEAHYSYVLMDGAALNVLDRRDGWAQLSLSDQLTGWVPEDVLEIGNQGYRYHYNNEMTALTGSITVFDEPSATARVQREITDWPVVDIIGWCGGDFSDICDGVWAIVFFQEEVGYVRLNTLSYGNG